MNWVNGIFFKRKVNKRNDKNLQNLNDRNAKLQDLINNGKEAMNKFTNFNKASPEFCEAHKKVYAEISELRVKAGDCSHLIEYFEDKINSENSERLIQIKRELEAAKKNIESRYTYLDTALGKPCSESHIDNLTSMANELRTTNLKISGNINDLNAMKSKMIADAQLPTAIKVFIEVRDTLSKTIPVTEQRVIGLKAAMDKFREVFKTDLERLEDLKPYDKVLKDVQTASERLSRSGYENFMNLDTTSLQIAGATREYADYLRPMNEKLKGYNKSMLDGINTLNEKITAREEQLKV